MSKANYNSSKWRFLPTSEIWGGIRAWLMVCSPKGKMRLMPLQIRKRTGNDEIPYMFVDTYPHLALRYNWVSAEHKEIAQQILAENNPGSNESKSAPSLHHCMEADKTKYAIKVSGERSSKNSNSTTMVSNHDGFWWDFAMAEKCLFVVSFAEFKAGASFGINGLWYSFCKCLLLRSLVWVGIDRSD